MTTANQISSTLREQGTSSRTIKQFEGLFQDYLNQQNTTISWDTISSPANDAIMLYDELPEVSREEAKGLLSEIAVCRLNGGLGTSMGCVGPKSAIEVKNNESFLDLIVSQIKILNEKYNADVPLVLMNSFNTQNDTLKIVRKYDDDIKIINFEQNRYPRLRRDSLLPLSEEKYGIQAYYPPGHGDFYQSVGNSGVLDQMLSEGKRYMYVANADNLGASVDLKILKLMKTSNTPFIMEVTDKTRADVKGGTLISTDEKSLRLLEIAQVPKDYVEEFKSVKKFKIFNTNNVWVDLVELKKKLESNTLKLDVIVNPKTVDHLPVIQLETAIGCGINNFEGGLAVRVPRTRFVPIKKTDDLLLIQSNMFIFEDGVLKRNPERQFDGLPLIRLGEHFQDIEEYQRRFETTPDILELDILTVVGDVYFGKNMTLRGNVILVCESGELRLPDRSLLENKVLTGSIKMGEL